SVTVSGLPFSNATAARVFMAVFLLPPLGWASRGGNPKGQKHPPQREPAHAVKGGKGKTPLRVPRLPPHQEGAPVGLGSGHRTMRIPMSRKNFKYRWKSITQRSLTEIEPSRKSAAARKAPFYNLRSEPPHENVTRPATRQLRRYQTNFGRTCYGNDLNSSGSGQRRETRLGQLRGGNASVQMREQSRRGERYVPVRL